MATKRVCHYEKNFFCGFPNLLACFLVSSSSQEGFCSSSFPPSEEGNTGTPTFPVHIVSELVSQSIINSHFSVPLLQGQ